MRKLLGPALCSLALLAVAPVEAQQSTTPDVCAGGQMRGPDGECIPGAGMGTGATPGGVTTAGGSPSGGTAAGTGTEESTGAALS